MEDDMSHFRESFYGFESDECVLIRNIDSPINNIFITNEENFVYISTFWSAIILTYFGPHGIEIINVSDSYLNITLANKFEIANNNIPHLWLKISQNRQNTKAYLYNVK